MFFLKLAITLAALGFALSRASLHDLAAGLARLSAVAFLASIALTIGNLGVGAVRWRILLEAYGAKRTPSVLFLWRAQLVGHFYNTFVPGNVGGDVLRAHVTRSCFDGPLGSYMVVAQERFFGLAGLSSLAAIGLCVYPLPGIISPYVLASFALVAGVIIASVPILGRKIGGRLPGRVGEWAVRLPVVERPLYLLAVYGLSFVSHGVVAITGYVLVSSLAPAVSLSQALVLVPVAMASMYLPSAAGLGVREAAFVFFFGRIGVGAAEATITSLSFFVVYAITAALGGALHLISPLKNPNE